MEGKHMFARSSAILEDTLAAMSCKRPQRHVRIPGGGDPRKAPCTSAREVYFAFPGTSSRSFKSRQARCGWARVTLLSMEKLTLAAVTLRASESVQSSAKRASAALCTGLRTAVAEEDPLIELACDSSRKLLVLLRLRWKEARRATKKSWARMNLAEGSAEVVSAAAKPDRVTSPVAAACCWVLRLCRSRGEALAVGNVGGDADGAVLFNVRMKPSYIPRCFTTQ